MNSIHLLALAAAVVASVAVSAQAPTRPAAGRQTPSAPASKPQGTAPAGAIDVASIQSRTDQLIEPPGFTYNPEGRRDPFVSLLRRGLDARSATTARPSGLAGLSVAEVTLRGTIRSGDGFVAILQGADQKAYIVRPGDKLFDGTVRRISQNDIVILQQVNDPLSLEKQREVRKLLRQIEAN